MITLDREKIPLSIVGTFTATHDVNYAEGPFILESPEFEVFGTHLEQNGDYISLYAGGRMYTIDDNYVVFYSKNSLTFRSDLYDSTYIVRPVRLEDAEIAYTDPEFSTLEELLYQSYTDMMTDGLFGPNEMPTNDPITAAADQAPELPIDDDLPEYGITIDNEGNVLELIKTQQDGMFVRDQGEWVAIDMDADEETYPTIYGQEWKDVSEGAVDIFDTAQNNDDLKEDVFLQYISN